MSSSLQRRPLYTRSGISFFLSVYRLSFNCQVFAFLLCVYLCVYFSELGILCVAGRRFSAIVL